MQQSSSSPAAEADGEEDIFRAIRKGLPSAGALAAKLLQTVKPLQLIDEYLIPALNAVGDAYEKGTLFLPQLIAARRKRKALL